MNSSLVVVVPGILVLLSVVGVVDFWADVEASSEAWSHCAVCR